MRHRLFFVCAMAGALVASSGHARAQAGLFSIPDSMLSPNHEYGVRVPDAALVTGTTPTVNGEDFPQDQLVDVKTGNVLATLPGRPRALHDVSDENSPPPFWSADSSILVWVVEGKWAAAALSVYKLEGGAVKWQVDVLRAVRLAMLNRALKTGHGDSAPIAGVDNVGDDATPDGFTIDAYLQGSAGLAQDLGPLPLSFPLKIHADLTSNPKGLDLGGGEAVNAQLDATVDGNGQFTVTQFHLGKPAIPPRNWDAGD
jgi:hypothetical protein